MANLYSLCILTRFTLFLLSLYGSDRVQRVVAYAAIGIGLGFFNIYLTGSRTAGFEVPGDGRIWWNSLRPLHGLLYLSFAYGHFTNFPCASYFLLADVVAGIVAYIAHYRL